MFNDPFGPPIPPGAVPVGNGFQWPDMNGGLHNNPGDAIAENQRVESDYSRGASGGCGQTPENVPNPANNAGQK